MMLDLEWRVEATSNCQVICSAHSEIRYSAIGCGGENASKAEFTSLSSVALAGFEGSSPRLGVAACEANAEAASGVLSASELVGAQLLQYGAGVCSSAHTAHGRALNEFVDGASRILDRIPECLHQLILPSTSASASSTASVSSAVPALTYSSSSAAAASTNVSCVGAATACCSSSAATSARN